MIELYNFLENNRTQIVSTLLTRIPKDTVDLVRVGPDLQDREICGEWVGLMRLSARGAELTSPAR